MIYGTHFFLETSACVRPPWFTPKKVSSFLPPSHVVDGIGVLINIFKWKVYDYESLGYGFI
jgi:hypothetical protein